MKKDFIAQLDFQQLDFAGLKTLLTWAASEGWNPGTNDAEIFWQTDPHGFYGYYDNNQLVAGGAIVCYNGAFGFMGLFIVKPEYRGFGLGRALWYKRRDKLISRLKPGAAIGMDGVVGMQGFYKKGGFNISFSSGRYEATGKKFAIDQNISGITPADLPEVIKFDENCFGVSRTVFLENWLCQAGSSSFKYMLDGKLAGIATIRKALKGYKIGPLFADSSAIAEELYKACSDSVAGETLYLDVPETNSAAIIMITRYGGNYVFECGRMYWGTPPAKSMDKVFGITTFELG